MLPQKEGACDGNAGLGVVKVWSADGQSEERGQSQVNQMIDTDWLRLETMVL